MKLALVFFAVVSTLVYVSGQLFDHESEAHILDPKAFKDLFDCVMVLGPCSDKQQKYRETIPEYINTRCRECTPQEKQLFDKYDAMIAERYPHLREQVHGKFGNKTLTTGVNN